MVAEDFLTKCKRIHGNMYDYTQSVYVNERTKVVVTCTSCNTVCKLSPKQLRSKHRCKWCVAIKRKEMQEQLHTEKQQKKEQQKIDIYKSRKSNSYKPLQDKIPKPKKHLGNVHTHTVKPPPVLNDQPTKPKKRKRKKRSRWSDSSWKKAGERSKAFHAFAVYVVLCYDTDTEEKFIKIGKTFQVVEGRFREFPYRWILLAYWSGSAEQASKTEREMHKLYKDYSYAPKKSFGGQSECFSMELLSNINTEKDIHE